jgi:hypothetical protein
MINRGTEVIRKAISKDIARRKETKTDMTKADLRAMLESFEGTVEVVAPRAVVYRQDMCKSKWTSIGGVSLCNVVNPIERAKSVMEVLKR